MQSGYPLLVSEPNVVGHIVRLLGTGASAPTKEVGAGITVTRTGAGVYKLTWAENPFTYMGMLLLKGAATPGDVKNHDVVRDTYDSSAFALEISFFDASGTAHDLAANEYFDAIIMFRRSGVGAV